MTATIANNCKALSENELEFMNKKYSFWIEDDDICVQCKNRARITRHSKHEKFSINVKRIRKVTYGIFAIQMFEQFLKNDKTKHLTLTDVQNALNVCRLTYQPMTEDSVLKVLKIK